MEPKKYIERIIASYELTFGKKPSTKPSSPLKKGDHPELDTSDVLDEIGIQQYQSLIGSLQWMTTLGRFDITTAVMSLSSFLAAPRQGHLDRAKRICGYVVKMKHAAIRICTNEPDFSDVPHINYDWSYSVYRNVKEEIPSNTPCPLGHYVQLSHYVDANLMHCMLTGRSGTGILHFMNQTPIDWFSKKQSTVETATFGSDPYSITKLPCTVET